MPIGRKDIDALRRLGEAYMDIASLPVHERKIALWKQLNAGAMCRPMVCIDQLPYNELNGEGELTCTIEDPFFRGIEDTLRKTIYRWRHFPVDMVIEPFITIPKPVSISGYGLDIQVERLALQEGTTAPAQHFTRVLWDEDDILKIEDMRIELDGREADERFEQAKEVFGGALPLVQGHGIQFHLGIWDYLTQLIGVQDAYLEIFDRPEFIHACMERLTQATIAGIERANELSIHDDIANVCHCSYVYSDELLPQPGQGRGPVSKNSWAFGMAQLFTSVSPRVTEEFEVPYISRMAQYFGGLYYGCCDRLDDRLEIVKRIPNVRKLSCSPWSDRRAFAERLGGEIVMSYKPSPAPLATGAVDWDAVRNDLAQTVRIARANRVNLEIILKDISTVACDPSRLSQWTRIATDVVENG